MRTFVSHDLVSVRCGGADDDLDYMCLEGDVRFSVNEVRSCQKEVL